MSPRLQVRAVAAAGSQPADIADTRRKWAALREAQLTSKGAEHLSGTGTTLNLDKTWSLLCADSSSSFLESVFIRLPDGNDREYRAAFDEEAGVAWQEDMNGFALVLESEDVDKHLLSTWLRSGQVRRNDVFATTPQVSVLRAHRRAVSSTLAVARARVGQA